jgi:hypothetical protein
MHFLLYRVIIDLFWSADFQKPTHFPSFLEVERDEGCGSPEEELAVYTFHTQPCCPNQTSRQLQDDFVIFLHYCPNQNTL